MVNLKACSRCGGDVLIEEYLGESDFVCLQCGHRTAVPAAQPAYRIVRRRRTTPVKRAA
ncbi:MAG: hypothetical protein WD904_10315 [Dehalococcoidia bacterium]